MKLSKIQEHKLASILYLRSKRLYQTEKNISLKPGQAIIVTGGAYDIEVYKPIVKAIMKYAEDLNRKHDVFKLKDWLYIIFGEEIESILTT